MTERGKKIRDAFFKKYGVYHPSQLPHVKDKIRQKRENGAYDKMVLNMKSTLKEKYGDENYNNLEKAKRTKLEKYGDEHFNNRDKMLKTNNEKYGMNVSPNTLKSTQKRLESKQIGFESKKYKQYLVDNNITNVSQLDAVKEKHRARIASETVADIFDGGRLHNIVTPLFTREQYAGSSYDTLYKFTCCKCGNNFEDNLYSGNIPRCLNCNPHNRFASSIETEILSFLHEYNVVTKPHDRTILGGEEIDILLPQLNMAIECDGIYWHGELAGKKNKKYHLSKTNRCAEKNIELMHIWDWEWKCKQDIVKSILLNKIKKSEKFHARKCVIKEVSNVDKTEFLIKNHIQGDDTSSIRIGLYKDDVLLSVMTFVKSRYDKKYQYELSRYCNTLNTHIVGGASKLFAHFVKNYDVNSVVTYSDKRLFTGSVYKNIGMRFVSHTPAGYHYFHTNNCVPIGRSHFQKHKLNKKLKQFDTNLSEWKNMQINGYDRIWDCGHFKFDWTRPM